MNESDADRLANEVVVTGALFAVLSTDAVREVVQVVELVENEAAMIVRFNFMQSAYRITVTMEPDTRVTPPGEG